MCVHGMNVEWFEKKMCVHCMNVCEYECVCVCE